MRTSTRLLPLFLLGVVTACDESGGGDAQAPAHLENPTPETQLTTVHLTAQAAQRIGIELAAVERTSVQARRGFGGELMTPSGAVVTLTAPRAATVLPPEGGTYPVAGDVVTSGQVLIRLATLPADAGRAREDAAAAEARAANARAKADRAQRLLDQGIASRAEVEDAQAELASAAAAAAAANARLSLIASGAVPDDDADLSPLNLTAPASGVVLAVRAVVGQTVPDGSVVLEMVDADPLWVRVPVYAGDQSRIVPDAPATVIPGGADAVEGVTATRIRGPLTADPTAASVDLFYRVPNPDLRLRPGERVRVSVPLGTTTDGLVVPWQSIVIDINGGTWVYHVTGDQAYTRTRVEVADVVDGVAVLRRGLPEGSQVVYVGAAELFSTEFGTSH